MTEDRSGTVDVVDEVFGAGGLLSTRFDGYEPRAQQVEVSRAILQAVEGEHHLIAEAPTGTGKSLAYLVPLIRYTVDEGIQGVVATANIALQEQIVQKDLPTLQEILPDNFTFALLKGKSNYGCRRRIEEYAEQAASGKAWLEPALHEDLRRIVEWAKVSKQLDVSELSFTPSPPLWSQCCSDADECDGELCKDQCGYVNARNRAYAATIVVTNYHMLFTHFAILGATKQHLVLPDLSGIPIVCDEAHEVPEIAREFFGWDVTEFALYRLQKAMRTAADEAKERDKGNAADLAEMDRDLRERGRAFFDRLASVYRSDAYEVRLKQPGMFDPEPFAAAIEPCVEHWSEAYAEIEQTVNLRRDRGDSPDRKLLRALKGLQRLISLGQNLQVRIRAAAALECFDEVVYWIEEDKKGRYALRCKPIDASPYLRQFLFRAVPDDERAEGTPNTPSSVILTSATLSTGGNFDFITGELGFERGTTIQVDSPFDHQNRVLFVVPGLDTLPNERGYVDEVCAQFRALLDVVGGRTLGLFTSYRALNAVRDAVRGCGHRVLCQGDRPRTQLVADFRDDVDSVLIGTTSLWTGVDVKGDSLSCLVIDKIPFPSPGDPIMDAIQARNRRWFFEYSVPKACILLKQGVGRLIRSTSDYGVIVMFDRRIVEKSYGGAVVRSLPPCTYTRDGGQIAPFLAHWREQCSAPASP